MNASTWISRSVSRLRAPAKDVKDVKDTRPAPLSAATKKTVKPELPPRSLSERLDATLRRHGEAMAPRALRRALTDLGGAQSGTRWGSV